MFIPHLAMPIAVYVTVADGLPNWDMTASCRGAASAGYVAQSEGATQELPCERAKDARKAR